ncbi:MAG: nucleotidyltransferase family protein, partial [Mailhella sp.]|nr:nucleotidyltransferase family protein [Mailhella sp.]
MNACAIILAGGFSSRMAPRFKPLLPLPYAEGVRSALSALCSRCMSMGIHVLVVGGYRAEEVRAEALAAGASFIRNPRPEEGMFSSVRAGVSALPQACDCFFVQPADIPLVRKMTLQTLLDARSMHPGQVFLPTYRGRSGHPPLFPASAKHLLIEQPWSGGLRQAMAEMPCVKIPCADSLMLRDMDTIEDYALIQKLAPGIDKLDPEEAGELLDVMHVPGTGKAHARAVGAVAKAFALCL